MANALYQYSGANQHGRSYLGARRPRPGVFHKVESPNPPDGLVSQKPKGAPATPAAPAKPTTPDPRDATYWAQRAKLLSQNTQDLSKLEQTQSYEDTDFAEAIRRRALQRDKDQQQIKQGANNEGLLFSGQLGKRQGEYDVAYAQQGGDAQQAYERAKAERAPVIQALRSALQSGLPLDEAALYAESVDRQIGRDAENPPNPYAGIDFNALQRMIAAQRKSKSKKRRRR